ncbi:hypothetical protein LPJ57_005127 [Coemansia sp. RSA 486]|nr:hypothetical protein LPJ57_005127 [Coemansia sp. RSA 486]
MLVHAALAAISTVALVTIAADTDYQSFMDSLSYNWQNEFSDLRYQIVQLQKDDPQAYSQLAAQMGLKAGATISIPSQFDKTWASMFVQAAGLYTPPAATFDPAQAKPTATDQADENNLDGNLFASALEAKPSSKNSEDKENTDDNESDNSDDSNDDNSSDDGNDIEDLLSSHSKSKGSSSSSHHKSTKSQDDADSDADSEDNGDEDDDDNTSQQFGNPVVGNLNTGNTPIVPTGQGYSSAGALAVGALSLAMPVVLSFI